MEWHRNWNLINTNVVLSKTIKTLPNNASKRHVFKDLGSVRLYLSYPAYLQSTLIMARQANIPVAICIVFFVAFMFGRPSDGQQLPTKNPTTIKQGTVSIWISLGRARQRLQNRLVRQLEGNHIYWSFKQKGAAFLMFYMPFRSHIRKQLSSSLPVNRPYSNSISIYNKSPLAPLVPMAVTTVFYHCTSPFYCVTFLLK